MLLQWGIAQPDNHASALHSEQSIGLKCIIQWSISPACLPFNALRLFVALCITLLSSRLPPQALSADISARILIIRNLPRTQDNDIILCDGECSRAFHANCVIPPLSLEQLESNEPWFCPTCQAKVRTVGKFYNAH